MNPDEVLTRTLKVMRNLEMTIYHCGEKIAKLKLIHFELIFAN